MRITITLTFSMFYLKPEPTTIGDFDNYSIVANIFLLSNNFSIFLFYRMQKPNSLSPSMMQMVQTRSMPMILATFCEHSIATQHWLWSKSWAAPKSAMKNFCHSMNSCQSSLKWKKTKNKVATKISLNVLNCTTKMKMVQCCSLNWTTLCLLSVSSHINFITHNHTPSKTTMINRIKWLLWFRSGEPLDNEQVETLFKDCMGEENDDGEIKYGRKCSDQVNF